MEFKAKMINDKVDGQCDKKMLPESSVGSKAARQSEDCQPSGAKGQDLDLEVRRKSLASTKFGHSKVWR